MIFVTRLILVVSFVVALILCVCNLKSHNMYPKLDEYIKGTLAFNFLYMVLLSIYLVYRVVTM